MVASVSVGVAGSLGPERIARIARRVEDAGLAALWVNDTPDGDALAALAAAASTTSRLGLAVGVLPVDRRSPGGILARVADLPAQRVTLGIGSGAARSGQLSLVGDAVAALRAGTSAAVVVGALGPRMRRLAAERADGPLLSWLNPEIAADQAAEARAAASGVRVTLYVRTALDDAAVPRLREETALYASYPNYAVNFRRLALDPGDTVLGPETAATRLAAYRAAVDEVVLRAITPTDDDGDIARFVAAAASLAASA